MKINEIPLTKLRSKICRQYKLKFYYCKGQYKHDSSWPIEGQSNFKLTKQFQPNPDFWE